MKKANEWVREQKSQNIEMYEFVQRIQNNAYNAGVRDSLASVQLSAKTKVSTTVVGKVYETYSPSQGIKTIMVDQQSILKLLKDE